MLSNTSLSAELAEVIEDGYAEAWRCERCGAELFEECDLRKHIADTASFGAYLSRSHRIYTMRLLALGVTP